MLDLLGAVARETAITLYEGSLWILLGFAIAGALHVLVRPERLARHLGDGGVLACMKAALLGAPIPLCSCGVLPAAMTLRRKGASREATLSFLITTPEVGVDSMAVTTAYFGPVMALLRPAVAVVTGIVAGTMSRRLGEDGCAMPGPHAGDDHAHDHGGGSDGAEGDVSETAWGKVRRATRYAFVDLLDDIGFWLVLALVATGTLGALLPDDFFDRYFPSSIAAMALMVVLGAPLYVCASASTPLAALFVAKGASAGAALVFLLVGPATNGVTMVAMRRFFGPGLLRVYLGSIIGVALAAGLLVDLLLPDLGQSVRLGDPLGPELLAPAKILGAVALTWLLARSLRRTGVRAGLRELAANARAGLEWARDLRLGPVVHSRAMHGLVALWLLAAILGGFHRVPPGYQALVQRLGVLDGAPREPGLLYAIPLVDRVALIRTEEVRERPINFTRKPGALLREPAPDAPLYLTADENLLDVRAEVTFRARDPVAFRLRIEDPEAVLTALVRGQLVQAMAAHPIDAVYTRERAEVEAWLLRRVRGDAEALGLGLEVEGVRLLDVHAPGKVHDAFRDVASAHEDRLTAGHLAEEYAAGTVAVARGEAQQTLAAAQAWGFAREAGARGDAARFLSLAEAHRAAPAVTEARMYLELAERTLSGARKVIRTSSGGPQGYELWLRADGTPVVPPGVAPPPTPATAPRRPTMSAALQALDEEDDL